jgi:hypothetical protein
LAQVHALRFNLQPILPLTQRYTVLFCMTLDSIASVASCDVAVLMLDGNEPVGFGICSLIFPPAQFAAIFCCEMAMNKRASALLDSFAAGRCTSARPSADASGDRQGETRDVCHQQNRLHPRGGAGRRFAAFDKTASREHISGASLALARQRATPTSRFYSWAV